MGNNDRIDVLVGAQIGELKAGMDQAVDKVKSTTSQIQSDFQDIGSAIKTALAATVLGVGLYQLGDIAKNAFKQSIEAINEYQLITIGVAATIADMGKDQSKGQENYTQALAYSKDMYQELELAAAHHFASGKELIQGWNIMAQKGVILRKEEIDYMGIIVDRIKLATNGQVASLQIAQELRGILNGQARATDQVALILKDRFGPEWKKIVDQVKETGSLKPLADVFQGLGYANKDIENSLEAQRSTLSTLLTQVGRGGLEGTYGDIVDLIRQSNDYLLQHREELSGGIAQGWEGVKITLWLIQDILSGLSKGITIPISLAISNPEVLNQLNFLRGQGAGMIGPDQIISDKDKYLEKVYGPQREALQSWMTESGYDTKELSSRINEGMAGIAKSIDIGVKDIKAAKERADRELGGLAKLGKDLKVSPDFDTDVGWLGHGPTLPATNKGKGGSDKAGSGDKSRVSAWQAELEEMKINENAFFNFSKEREREFWTTKLALVEQGSEEYIGVRHKLFGVEQGLARDRLQNEVASLKAQQEAVKDNFARWLELENQVLKDLAAAYGQDSQQYQNELRNKERMALAHVETLRQIEQARIETQRKLAEIDLDIEREKIASQQQLGVITPAQEIVGEMALAQKRYQIQRQALLQELELNREKEKAYADTLNKLALLEKQHTQNLTKLEDQRQLAVKQKLQAMMAPLNQAINTSVTGMIQGTQRLSQVVNNALQNILASYLGMAAQMVTDWIAMELAKTTASAAGAASRAAVETTAATTGKGITVATGIAGITASAAEGAAAAYKAMAGIPVIGPALGAIAAAATFAGIIAYKTMIPSAAQGWDIPRGQTGIMRYHEEEMMLDAGLSNRIRRMTEPQPQLAMATPSGPSGGKEIHVHFHAMDGPSIKKFFNTHRDLVFSTVQGKIKDGGRL